MQYNAYQYNASEYDLINYSVNLSDSMTETDTLAKMPQMVRTDSQGSIDALSDGVSLAALLDTVTIYQRARTPFSYNNGRYNDYTYNQRFDDDEILLMATKALTDSFALSDTVGDFVVAHLINESLGSADTLSFSPTTSMDDFIFLSEFFNIQVSNKALNETLRVADWVGLKQNPQSQEWFD